MGIFFCPRLRAYWKKPDPPGTGPAYPLHPVTSPPNGAVESGQDSAQFTSRKDAVRFSSSGTSAGGLSEKLRKRFSRELKGLHGAPTRAARKSASSSFRDPSRFASNRLDTVSPVGFGSSLMSERGYDSDAQFISTPKQITRTPDRLVAENFVHETTSLSKLQSRGDERNGHLTPGSTSGVSNGDSVNAPGVDQTILEGTRNPWSSMDQAIWAVHPTPNPPFSRVGSSASRRVQAAQPYHAGFMTPRSAECVPWDKQDGYSSPSPVGTPKLSNPLHSSPTIPEGNHFSTSGCYEYRSRTPGHVSPVPTHYTTSVDSLAGPSTGLPVRKRRQQPPLSASGNASVHLEDMEIHRMLASRTTSPRVLSTKQSFEGNPWVSDVRLRKPTEQLIDDGPVVGKGKARDPVFGWIQNILGQGRNSAQHNADPVSPRKVSVGWMSGGRRLGYGYTLVSAAEENDRPSKEQSGPFAINGSSQDAPLETDTQTEKANLIEDQPQQQDITSLSKKAGTGLDISSIIGHINLRSWSGATNETAGDESLKSSLLGKFSKRKKDHSDPEPSAGAKDPWDFCAWVDPNQSPSEQQPPQASPSASSTSTEGRGMSLGRWSTLRRTGSLWARAAAKATAKLNASAGRFPVIQKKDGRAMKFRVLDRKRRAQTDEDGEPMVPLKQWPGGNHKSSLEEDGPSSPSVDPVRKQFSEQTGSTVVTDGWESNYQDCEEIFSVGE
ncbi:hypothetical protein ASPACDRAFT_57168 [Aspergillus aculeatus ATCC 16872]|uniref:Uncharacterized protein n=1 Tax=Aspergillus aculeatus (strain ATCC 16872 / CBS 172.66 / WB 5094) TaxID=690307 RepID=A0A1L9X673_ASPA1|nr:uncharacterized protein ASPACDRAFT_57168 [Aspergillus aculeatus ATCC 16872]OJK03788.1 hypothetical protein ASPACDRAFT_57168 [Aspergillus aculeatus ATCC 16872]